jgi:hypothetical protein
LVARVLRYAALVSETPAPSNAASTLHLKVMSSLKLMRMRRRSRVNDEISSFEALKAEREREMSREKRALLDENQNSGEMSYDDITLIFSLLRPEASKEPTTPPP